MAVKTEEKVYKVGEFELREKSGFSYANLAEVLDGMTTLLISRDEKDGVLQIMTEEVEFTARFMAVRFATDFDGDSLDLYKALRKGPADAEIFCAPEVEKVYQRIIDRWYDIEFEYRRREQDRCSAGAAARHLTSMLFGEGTATARNAAMIRSMLTQAMIDVRRDAKNEDAPTSPKVVDFSAFKAQKPKDAGKPEGDDTH